MVDKLMYLKFIAKVIQVVDSFFDVLLAESRLNSSFDVIKNWNGGSLYITLFTNLSTSNKLISRKEINKKNLFKL